tara:strand:+ start:1019 stop:1228 length:210 start_codon:yes stop_codon:yes gene_type:complete
MNCYLIKEGSLVKFIEAADRNTSGWNLHRQKSVGVITGVETVAGKPWYNVLFSVDERPVRVFHRDVEEM